MAQPFNIVSIGDSVPWGQGLPDEQKYEVLLKARLAAHHPEGVHLERLSHSGAIIGPGRGISAKFGEVPVALPTILGQAAAFTTPPATVDLVVLNGGINDVGVQTILNPLALLPSLASLIHRACYERMGALLHAVSSRCKKPSARILVTGYYPVLSDLSDPLGIGLFLGLHGVRAPDFIDKDLFHNAVVDRCEEFFNSSTEFINQAIKESGDPRIVFVPSGFTDANAVYVPNTSLLFGLDDELKPQDPIAVARRTQCDRTFTDPLDFLNREQCYRASAGHPNPAGSEQYCKQLLAAIHA